MWLWNFKGKIRTSLKRQSFHAGKRHYITSEAVASSLAKDKKKERAWCEARDVSDDADKQEMENRRREREKDFEALRWESFFLREREKNKKKHWKKREKTEQSSLHPSRQGLSLESAIVSAIIFFIFHLDCHLFLFTTICLCFSFSSSFLLSLFSLCIFHVYLLQFH